MVFVQALKAIGDATYIRLSVKKKKKKNLIIIIENEREFQVLGNMKCEPSPGKCQVLPLKSHCPIQSLILN